MSTITIADHQSDVILDDITSDFYWDDKHSKNKKDNKETFDFTTFADKRFSEFLSKRNRIIIPDEDGELIELFITNTRKYRQTNGSLFCDVRTSAAFVRLKKAKSIAPHRTDALSAEAHARAALSGTEYEIGTVDFKGVRTFTFEERTNPYSYLHRIASEFGLELHFRVESDGNKITRRYVDLIERVGSWNGREATFGRDLEGIERLEDFNNIVTALIGIGPEREDGTRLEVLVENEEALQRWGRKNQHEIEEYEPVSDDPNMTLSRLRTLTENELEKRINSQVQYIANIVDLANVVGLEHEIMRFGDTIRIKDLKFNPPLYLEARIHTVERSIKNLTRKTVVLGDYIEYTEDDVMALIRTLQKEVNKKIGLGTLEAYAEPVIPEQDTPPSNPKKGDKWVDTSENPPQLKLYDGNEWHAVKGEKGDRGEPGKDGYTPIKGVDYFDGKDGQDGTSSYLWVRYSQNANGNPMSPDPTNAKYIGVATTETPSAPTSPSAYEWSLIKGSDGIPGEDGSDGRTSYLHIKYSNDGGQTFTGNNGEDVGEWIGTYVDFTQADSNNPSDYTWNKVKGEKGDKGEQGPPGIQGPPGEDGQSQYMHIRYSANSNGNPMTTTPQSNSKYIGLANTTSPTAPSSYTAYTWSLIRGADGQDGIPGPKGDDGQTTYTWVRYADDENGSGMSDSPHDKLYIGLAFNKTTPTESNNANDYTWSLMPQNIEIGGRNLATISSVGKWGNGTFNRVKHKYILSNSSGNTNVGLYIDRSQFENSTDYVVSFKVKKISGTVNSIAGHRNSSSNDRVYKDGLLIEGATWNNGDQSYNDSDEVHEYVVYFKTSTNAIESNNQPFYIQPNRSAYGESFEVEIWDLQLKKGNKATDWTPAPEDVQAEIDEAKGIAENAQQSADGKNTVYRQSSTPPTTNRKTGDMWFKTNEGNKMYVWTGSWTETKLDYQALAVGKLSAISADLGDVTSGKMTAVEVEGVTGTFGKVSVTDGDFTLKDSVTESETIINTGSNVVMDHSFELIKPLIAIEPIDPNNPYIASIMSVDSSSFENFFGRWNNTKPQHARMLRSYDAESSHIYAGLNSIILRGQSYGMWDQICYIPEQFRQTNALSLSCYVAPFEKTLSNVDVSLRIQLVNSSGAWLQDLASTAYTIDHTKKYNWQRVSVTFKGNLNLGGNRLRIRLLLNNNTSNAMLLCDGVQLVPFEHPTLYESENSLYQFMNGIGEAPQLVANNLAVTEYATIHDSWIGNAYIGNITRHAHGFLSLQNGWQNYGSGYQAARYTKTAEGVVYLSGLVQNGNFGSAIGVLPTGCRPNATEVFSVGSSDSGARIYVYANGNVIANRGSGFMSLSGISFLAEN